jgi:hypothetical protein
MATCCNLAALSRADAYPILDAVQGLPFPELITVYPDEVNKNLYYFVPTTMALVTNDDGSVALGVSYWGLTGKDEDGAGANLTFSVRPAVDEEKLTHIADEVKKRNPAAEFAFPPLVSSSVDAILSGAFHDKNQDTTQPTHVTGGTVDATQAFSISLTRIGGRAFANGTSDKLNVLAARYTYKILGIEKRLHARITVNQRRIYDHFKVSGGGSAWFGMVSSYWAADWQKLTEDGSIKIDILEGGEQDSDAYMLEVFKALVNAKVSGEGMFKPELKPGDIGGGSGQSSTMGWGFSVSSAWQHLDENKTFTFEIDKQKLGEREFQVGMSFAAVCAKYPDNFQDLTTGNKCIDYEKYSAWQKANEACLAPKLDELDKKLELKQIDSETYGTLKESLLDRSCL